MRHQSRRMNRGHHAILRIFIFFVAISITLPAVAQIVSESAARAPTAAKTMMSQEPLSSGVREGLANVNGIKLHYLIAGSGPPVVLLHGWANTALAWHRVMPLLQGHYTVIAPDMRGFGHSSRPLEGYDRATVASDIRALMDQLGYKRYRLAGHDLGAHVAFEIAAHHPGEVEQLVLLDGIIPGLAPWEALKKDPRMWHWSFYNVPDLPEALIAGRERVYLTWFIHTYTVNFAAVDADMDAVVEAYSQPGAIRAGLAMFRTSDQDAERNAEWLKSNKLTMPVLAIGGGKGVGSFLYQQMAGAGTRVTGINIEDCGHWLATECPVTVAKAMTDFFAGD